MNSDIAEQIVAKAKTSGASLVGITSIAALQNSPSHQNGGNVRWPEGTESVLVMALAHDRSDPELDWWDHEPGGTPGNRQLINIATRLQQWLRDTLQINARPLPYDIARGGIFLKDAAALAGLGVMGKNNLLITPEYGPQVRLRAMFLDADLKLSGPIDFHPCDGCAMPCLRACPQDAFQSEAYSRDLCYVQMRKDETNAVTIETAKYNTAPRQVVKYCRACELSCPVAQNAAT